MQALLRSSLLAILLALAPFGVEAQGVPSPHPQPGEAAPPPGIRRGPPPFAFLLSHREELGLSEEQARRIQEIGARLQAENAPHAAKLMRHHPAEHPSASQRRTLQERLRKLSPEQRRAELERHRARRQRHPALPPELQDEMHAIQENTRRAMEEVQSLLTAQQRERARQLLSPRIRRPESGHGKGGKGSRG